MVSAAVPPPGRKGVEGAAAVQVATRRARLSVTVTVPKAVGPMVVPGAPDPRLAVAGTVMESRPLLTVNVVGVEPVVAAAAGRAVAMAIAPLAPSTNSNLRMTGFLNWARA